MKIEITDKYFDEYKVSYESEQKSLRFWFILTFASIYFYQRFFFPALSEAFPDVLPFLQMVVPCQFFIMVFIWCYAERKRKKYKSELNKRAMKVANIQDVLGFAEKSKEELLEAAKQKLQAKDDLLESYQEIMGQKDADNSRLTETIKHLNAQDRVKTAERYDEQRRYEQMLKSKDEEGSSE